MTVRLAALPIALLISGCQVPAPNTTTAPAAAKPSATSASTDQRTAERRCENALRSQVDEGVAARSYELSEANSVVMLSVGGAEPAWRCLVASDGTVQKLSYVGSG